jgi:hypothetical protein
MQIVNDKGRIIMRGVQVVPSTVGNPDEHDVVLTEEDVTMLLDERNHGVLRRALVAARQHNRTVRDERMRELERELADLKAQK